MRFGFVGPSYTVGSTSIADEECINWYAQTVESQGAIVPTSAYGGKNAQGLKSYFATPGLNVFATFPESPTRGSILTPSGRLFVVSGSQFLEVFPNGSFFVWQSIPSDSTRASMACNGLQILIVSGGHAYCFTLATGAVVEVTGLLVGVPVKVKYSDSYFIVCFQNSNEFQLSQVLDGTTWPGHLVNEVSVFPDNIVSIGVNHRELWVFGQNHAQPYQDTGSAEVFDVIPGALIESGIAAPFCEDNLDNSLFWVSNDERGGRMAWRSNGYTPTRISTYAVEADLNSYPSVAGMMSYSYQDRGHLFWVIYIPGANWSWCFDVVEGMWHKRAFWNAGQNSWESHFSWNHVYAFGQHLVGDWNSANLYTMTANSYEDNGQTIRRLRRTPTILSEMQWVYHAEMTVDFEMGNLTQVAPSDLPNYAPALYGPNAGTNAVDTAIGGAAWNNPANVLLPGSFATANLVGTSLTVSDVEAFDSKLGDSLGPEHYFILVTFGAAAPPLGTTFQFAGVGTYTTLNTYNDGSFVSIAGGGSYLPTPTADQALFTTGTNAVPLQSNTSDTGTATTPGITQTSDALDVTGFGFALPATTTPAGIMVPILLYASMAGATLAVQLLKAGIPADNPILLPIPTNPTILYFGTPATLWGVNWAYSDINAATYGVRLVVTASSAIDITISAGLVQQQVYSPPNNPSYNYVGPAPVLVDGSGNPRPPQAMLRFSDTRGKTWSNEQIVNCGLQGDYNAHAIWRRLGRSRYRVYELSVSDPLPWVIVDAYLRVNPSTGPQ